MNENQQIEHLRTHAIQHLASHWHRYKLWCSKSNVPNVHGSIDRFYQGVIDGDALEKVKEHYDENHIKVSK